MPHSAARRLERAELRRGPPWTALDAALLALPVLCMVLAIIAPGLLADVGDTVVGPQTYVHEIGMTVSQALIAVSRWAVLLATLGVLWGTREAPWQQRLAWGFVAISVSMNFARNIYSANPATLSFEIGHAGFLILLWHLTLRPTIWARLKEAEERAAGLEAEVDRLRGRA